MNSRHKENLKICYFIIPCLLNLHADIFEVRNVGNALKGSLYVLNRANFLTSASTNLKHKINFKA